MRAAFEKGLGLGQPATTSESSSGPAPPSEVRSIQYLRGLAALGVLIFHAAERAGGAFGVGAAGVDVFFVISGFIMWVVTSKRPPSPGLFLWRRAQRIVPLYWAVTLVTAAVAVLIPGAFPVMQVTAQALLKSLLFIPYRDPQGLIAPLIVPGWTLNYEMFFYLVFAVGLIAPARLRPWLVSIALIALVAIRPLLDSENPLVATYTDPILLEFVAGVWLGRAWSQGRLPGAAIGWSLVGLGLVLFAAGALAGVDVSQARILLWGVPALLLVTGAVSVERAGSVPSLPPLRILGDASYSLYLVHGLAISAVLRAMKMVGVTAPAAVFVAAIVAGIVAGLIAYHLIERPAMKLFRTGFGGRAAQVAAPAAP